jgi:hypothetical protein
MSPPAGSDMCVCDALNIVPPVNFKIEPDMVFDIPNGPIISAPL